MTGSPHQPGGARPATRRTTWQELLRPGRAEPYFAAEPRPAFRADAGGYDVANAWWLAELSRLTYRAAGRDRVLHAVGLAEVRRFAHRATNCAVFAPRDAARRDLAVVVFEGTTALRHWRINLDALRVDWSAGGRVHQGFARALRSVWDALDAWLSTAPGALFYAGHSLGGALATLAASLRRPHAAYTFGAPMVGDAAFAAALADVPLYRIVHHRDVVPAVPGARPGFCHAGELRYIDGSGEILVDPSAEIVAADHADGRRAKAMIRDWLRPPAPLGDHAPACYVDALRAQLARHGRAT